MTAVFHESGTWFRGNLHTHTNQSDATWTIDACCGFYEAKGYDFLAVTDHWKITDSSGSQSRGLLMIPGVEINGWTGPEVQHHLVGLGVDFVPERDGAETLQSSVDAISGAGGLAIVAHPKWSKQRGSDLAGTRGAHILEVFNATSEVREGNGVSAEQWNELLNRGERWFAIASDDAHMLPGHDDCGRGWVMVKCYQLTEDAVLDSLVQGRFYSTTGPRIEHLSVSSDRVEARSDTPVVLRAIVGGEATQTVVEPERTVHHSVEILPGWSWLRVELEDAVGGTAWSNPVFAGDLPV